MRQKKALCLASMASNLDNFNRNNVKILQEQGYVVTLASNFQTAEDSNSSEKIKSFMDEMDSLGVNIVQIDFTRRIGHIPDQIKSYKQVKNLLTQSFDLVHCHSPICAAITRICTKKYRKKGTNVIYTAHGFHFYTGAPLKNWLIYYPIEKWLSRYTDVLITINKEDYKRAIEKFHAKKTVYIPGVGVNTEKFAPRKAGRDRIRKELGLNDNNLMILSVGELNDNKNHSSVIKAIAGMNLTYVIVGKGDLKDTLEKLAQENNVDLRLMGFRSDVADFYNAADAYVLPSIREGLNVSLMEAMASGLPIACGRIRGNTDLIEDKDVLFDPLNIDEIRSAITVVLENRSVLGKYNIEKIHSFDLTKVEEQMSEIYHGV